MNERAQPPASALSAVPLIVVVSGPGGVGKGTIVDALLRRDSTLLLSRSWTTREQRPGEHDEAYVFTTRAAFEQHRQENGFLEWTEFLGDDRCYSTRKRSIANSGRHGMNMRIDPAGSCN